MSRTGYTSFSGASGKSYSFDIYTLDSVFDSVGGVYIFVNGANCIGHSYDIPCDPILIDETNDLSELGSLKDSECLNKNDADSLCVYFEDDEDLRRKIYGDISKNYQDVPCE